MLISTRAIVLRATRHSDKGVVANLYTEHHGLRSYALRSGGRSGVPPALLEPLQRLSIVASERGDRDLHQLKEVRPERPFMNVGSDPVRGGVVLFLQEVLQRTLREESGDAVLFRFVHGALDAVDTAPDLGHFPIAFLSQLAQQLGFAPEQPDGPVDWFDLQEGIFSGAEPPHAHSFSGPAVHLFIALLATRLEDIHRLSAPAALRRELLEKLLLYFRSHVAGFGQLRSPAVLHTVLG